MVRTLKLKLLIDQKESELLDEVSRLYNEVCNAVSAHIFENNFQLNFMSLQKDIYDDLRERFGLNSQMTISALKTVTARYKTVKEQLRSSPMKFRDKCTDELHIVPRTLDWLAKPLIFKADQADFVRARNYRLTKGKLSLSTQIGTILVDFQAAPKFHKLLDEGWICGTATLIRRKRTWYLCVPMKSPKAEKDALSDKIDRSKINKIVGIDRGIVNLLCAADSTGKTTFSSGRAIQKKRDNFARLRHELQSKNTHSARKKLKRIEQRENRWMTDVNHVLSKALVERYGAGTLFVIEDLEGVSFSEENLRQKSSKSRRNLRSWAFFQFEQFLVYKADEHGSYVLKVPAKYTSQRCPKCGVIDKEQRHHDEHEYRCRCGFRTNDDRVGALNLLYLGKRFLAGEDKPKFVKSKTLSIAT